MNAFVVLAAIVASAAAVPAYGGLGYAGYAAPLALGHASYGYAPAISAYNFGYKTASYAAAPAVVAHAPVIAKSYIAAPVVAHAGYAAPIAKIGYAGLASPALIGGYGLSHGLGYAKALY